MIPATYRAIYGDTDNMGVVYYANYLRFFELGRNEYLRARGLTYAEVETRGLFLPVTESRCRYLRSARYDDLITIETRVTRAKGARVVFEYVLKNEGGEILAEGMTEHGCVAASGRPVRLTPDVIEALAPEGA